MTERITIKNLEAVCDRLNRTLNRPAAAYTKENGQYRANVGNFYIDQGYGGVSLHEITNERGGVTEPLTCGHIPKRELYHRMHAMLDGIEIALNQEAAK